MKLLLLILGIVLLVLGVVTLVATGIMGFAAYVPLIVIAFICLSIRGKQS